MAPTVDTAKASSSAAQFARDLPTPEPESSLKPRRPYKLSTLCATVENPDAKDQYGSSSVPIYQTATFKGVGGEYDYSRSGNPTRSHLQHHLAKISSAGHALTVSSGMACLDIITRLLKPGDEVIAGDDLYGGTNRLLGYLKSHVGIIVHHVDTTVVSAVAAALVPGKTAMVLLETPTNPLLKIVDIPGMVDAVRTTVPSAVVVVDNTMMSPFLQRPLELGADIVYDSGTKYLSGHHDLMAGVITCNRDDLAGQMAFMINSVGNALSPFDSFLLLRGTKTLAIRLERQQATARTVAAFLHRLGFKVHYPGLEGHPGKEIHDRIADGPGAVLSFTTGDKALSERIVGATRLWGISVSFGAVNSLISMPCVMSHASIDAATRAARGLPEDLIRLCVGIEDAGDLLDDLERALLDAGAITLEAGAEGHQYVRAQVRANNTPASNRAVGKLAFNPSEPQLGAGNREWLVSAPGKVILFGEHAVVHGVTALAASVDLRCYGLSTPRHDGKLSVTFADIGGFAHEWEIDELPWHAVAHVGPGEEHPEVLHQQLLDALDAVALPLEKNIPAPARAACLAFLYLYMMTASAPAGGTSTSENGSERPALHFAARSTLPIGAGLGSSASFSVCAASAVLLVHGRITPPAPPAPSRSGEGSGQPGHVHISHQGRRALPTPLAEEVNRWAFVAEKILHGTPSGVDNSVAVYGGALAYTKGIGAGRKNVMEPILGFKSLRFLLTDSKVPRDTKALVAGVGAKKLAEPELVNSLLASIQDITDEARRALADPELDRPALLEALAALVRENHAHLVALGVSHPVLEAIREATAKSPYGLATKLTGAGGGGCAVTLVPDDFSSDALAALFSELANAGYTPYATAVGGSGLGVLSPWHAPRPLATPPDSPRGEASALHGEAGDDHDKQGGNLRSKFENTPLEGLTQWAEDRGRWLFV